MKFKTMVRKGIAIGITGIMLASLAACGSSSDDSADATTDAATEESTDDSADATVADTGITLTFQQWWGAELPDGYLEAICDDYYEATGITVELLTAPWSDTKTAITAGATNGTIADIVSVDGAWLTEFSDMGILADVSAAGVDSSLASDIWSVDGTNVVVPVLNFSYPMFVNLDILEAAGVEEIPTTWTELIEASELITDAGYFALAINLGTTNANGIQNVFGSFGWASGIELKDDSGSYSVADNDALVDVAELFSTLYDADSLYPGMSTLEEAEMTSNFAAGNCAFTIASAATMSNYTEFDFATTTVPVQDGYDEAGGICYASWAVGITENCEYKEEAADFINYLLGGVDGTDGYASAGLAEQMTAFPNSTVAEPDYSDTPEQFQSYYELYKENYVINEYIGLPDATATMTSMTNDLVLYLEGDITVDELYDNWQAYLDAATE